MNLWTEEQVTTYFESGGTEEPKAGPALPPMAPKLPPVSEDVFKKWFPKAYQAGNKVYKQPPAFRMVRRRSAAPRASRPHWRERRRVAPPRSASGRAGRPGAAVPTRRRARRAQVCFSPAGCSESVWSGKGMRQPNDNPYVQFCKDKGGEMLACELP
eukprot:397138-Prymnesium_polylepis.1